MEAELVGQPFASSGQLGAVLGEELGDEAFTSFWFAAAWVKPSGVLRLAREARAFRDRGGRIEGILGIDHGGATFEGLEAALEWFDDVFVFHHPGERTFHPKLYVAQGEELAKVTMGSGNFSKGGLFTNYEAAVRLTLDRDDAGDEGFLSDLRSYYDSLLGMTGFCQPLSEELIERLRADPGTNVMTERQANKKRNVERRKEPSQVFGGDAEAELLDAVPTAVGAAAAKSPREPGEAVEAARPVRRWFKMLPPSDAQQLPEHSSDTGAVTLVKAGHPIKAGTYFRDEFFGEEVWSNNAGEKAEARVEFELSINGLAKSSQTLTLVHDPRFESDQGNRTTLLRWGPLNEYLRARDLSGEYLTLEAFSDGSYRLIIAAEPAGEFLK
ncbi:MAG TPA: phospholipase D family protein [Solirubrobacterales bacterium]